MSTPCRQSNSFLRSGRQTLAAKGAICRRRSSSSTMTCNTGVQTAAVEQGVGGNNKYTRSFGNNKNERNVDQVLWLTGGV